MSRPFNHASAPDSVTCLRGWQPRPPLGPVRLRIWRQGRRQWWNSLHHPPPTRLRLIYPLITRGIATPRVIYPCPFLLTTSP
ncbi:hypothetical protein B565_0414 [Aeromonas veronii B565]|nr:hypothetical protein B565_0414 [Aeromonas veronii B565]